MSKIKTPPTQKPPKKANKENQNNKNDRVEGFSFCRGLVLPEGALRGASLPQFGRPHGQNRKFRSVS